MVNINHQEFSKGEVVEYIRDSTRDYVILAGPVSEYHGDYWYWIVRKDSDEAPISTSSGSLRRKDV